MIPPPFGGTSSIEVRMLWILIVLVVLLLLVGGGGYRYRSNYGGYYNGGIGLLGFLVILFLVLLVLGVIHL
jgi:hypothetical protein